MASNSVRVGAVAPGHRYVGVEHVLFVDDHVRVGAVAPGHRYD